MTFNKLLILLTAFALFLTACGGGNPASNANTTANANTVAPANSTNTAPPSNSAVATSTATPSSAATNDAPTVKPVVLAYYEALKTKNEEALRKVYSKQTLASLEGDMKEDGEKSLIKFITDIEPVPPQPYEVRNEQIKDENTIVADMISPQYKNGIKIKFVKENGEWKLTNESPEFQKK